jgi:hypothetical protein
VGSTAYDVRVEYNKGQFQLVCPALAGMVVERTGTGGRRRNLIAHLNAEQAFRIITDSGLVYANGQFYKPRLPLWGPSTSTRIELLNILVAQPALAAVESEKGTGKGTFAKWPDKSVFAFIDSNTPAGLLAQEKLDPDLLVCYDIGNEVADFIAVQQSPPRIALIHAKCGKEGENLSATAFHDICSQAVKNLGVLTPQFDRKLKNPGLWNNDWKEDGLVVSSRLRRAGKGIKAADAWNMIGDVVRHPAASREVWIVMGHGMSRSAFETARSKSKPAGYVIQLAYLLQSTWSTVSSVGASLKVFCKP